MKKTADAVIIGAQSKSSRAKTLRLGPGTQHKPGGWGNHVEFDLVVLLLAAAKGVRLGRFTPGQSGRGSRGVADCWVLVTHVDTVHKIIGKNRHRSARIGRTAVRGVRAPPTP